MKPQFDFDALIKNEHKRQYGPGDFTHVGENVNLSLRTKSIETKEEGGKENEKKT